MGREEGAHAGSFECALITATDKVWVLHMAILAINIGGRNKFFQLYALLCIVFLLFVTSAANASPTVTHSVTDLSANLSNTDTQTTISGAINNAAKPVNAELAHLGKEFLQPPASFVGLSNSQSNIVKPLPAVPAAVLMLLVGFLCVSLYRDRKVWLAALAALLWAGQAGFHAVPQLAYHLCHKTHNSQYLSVKLAQFCLPENSTRLRSDIDGTQYIGLLHHLGGIPDDKSAINSHTSQPAIIFNNSLTLHFHCLAFEAKPFIYFSPAFIFVNLPRGPPFLT